MDTNDTNGGWHVLDTAPDNFTGTENDSPMDTSPVDSVAIQKKAIRKTKLVNKCEAAA